MNPSAVLVAPQPRPCVNWPGVGIFEAVVIMSLREAVEDFVVALESRAASDGVGLRYGVDWLKNYARVWVIRDGDGDLARCAHCFIALRPVHNKSVDADVGDILLPGGWARPARPARHPRGSLFDAAPLDATNHYSANYLPNWRRT